MHDEETPVTDSMFCVMPDNLQILGEETPLGRPSQLAELGPL
ncbi:hypothetical protein [Nitrosovibrio sp. Nv6]|nr:hypothetical protein [Nitrosovibrio sp. Nv6]